MQGVRQRILEIMQERGRVTVADLAEALDMAPVSVRHHLDILQGDGLIQVDGVRRRTGAGRPQHTYALTPEAASVFPKNYEALLRHLLVELKHCLPPEAVEDMIERVAQRMADEIEWDNLADMDFEARLDAVVTVLAEHGYLARWQRRQDGHYVLITANCPYAGLVSDHSELCRMDTVLVQFLLDREVNQEGVIRDGSHSCVYVAADAPDRH